MLKGLGYKKVLQYKVAIPTCSILVEVNKKAIISRMCSQVIYFLKTKKGQNEAKGRPCGNRSGLKMINLPFTSIVHSMFVIGMVKY